MWDKFFHGLGHSANLWGAACALAGVLLLTLGAALVVPRSAMPRVLALQNEGTQTAEAAATQTATAKSTATQTAEAAATQTVQALQALPAETQTAIAILTGTPTVTGTPPTATPTATGTPPTATPSPTPTQTNSPAPQDTETPTSTPIPTATFPPTATPIPSATAIRAPTVVRFVIEPNTVVVGQPVNVTWELRGVTSATLNYEGLSEPIDPMQGTRTLVPPGSTTLVLQASGPGGSVRQERSLTVEPPTPVPPPTDTDTPAPTNTPLPTDTPAPTTTPDSQPVPGDTGSPGELPPGEPSSGALPDSALPDGSSGSLPPTEAPNADADDDVGEPPPITAAEPTVSPIAEPTSAVALPALGSATGDDVTLIDGDPAEMRLPLRWVLVFVAGVSAVIGAALLSFGVLLILIRRGEE